MLNTTVIGTIPQVESLYLEREQTQMHFKAHKLDNAYIEISKLKNKKSLTEQEEQQLYNYMCIVQEQRTLERLKMLEKTVVPSVDVRDDVAELHAGIVDKLENDSDVTMALYGLLTVRCTSDELTYKKAKDAFLLQFPYVAVNYDLYVHHLKTLYNM